MSPADEADRVEETADTDAGNDDEAEEVVHRVAPRETVHGIARRYGVSWRDVVEWNNLRDANDIRPGQRLTIRPASGE